MPRDIFGEVVHPTARVGSRSKFTVAVSVAVHVLIAALVLILPLFAPEMLPMPRTVIAAFAAPPPPPPPIAVSSTPTTRETATPSPDVAPADAPASIEPEPATTGSVAGHPDGVPGGLPGGLVGSPGLVPDVPLPPAPAVVRPVPVGGRVKEPTKIRHVAPVYPVIAQQAQVQGVVIIEAVIGVDGRVQEARVLRSKPLLDEAALTAVRGWVFTPTLLNGVPVPVIMTVTVNFTLR